MKKSVSIGAVLILAVIPLMSCSSNNNTGQNTKNKQSTQSSVKKDAPKQSDTSSGTSSKSTSASNSGTSSSTSSNSSTSGSSSKSDTSSKSTGSDQQQSNSAPATSQQVLKNIAAALNTKVPLMLPSNVTVSSGKYLTATTKSQTWYYNTQLYEASKPTKINSSSASKGTPIALIEGTEYKNAAMAKQQIAGVSQVDTSNSQAIDLGHGIKGLPNGGAGHAYITWNEGRWTLWINSPSESKYQNPNYKNSKQVAEEAVAYLHDHALPAPQTVGVVKISTWNNSTQTTVNWQDHQMTYQVTSKDPLTALKVAVAMHHVMN